MTAWRPKSVGWRTPTLLTLTTLLVLAGCKVHPERKQIGGKGQDIQLTWEEEQLRGTDYGIDRDGNPPPLQDCEERAWKNIRALGLPVSTREFTERTGDSISHIGQYAFRKRAGYGGRGGKVGGDRLFYARLPDFSPQYHVGPACDPGKALKDAAGNTIDGSTCRRYDVHEGVAELVAISMHCIDRQTVSDVPELYWPARLSSDKSDAFMALVERRTTGKHRNLVDWSRLQRRARPELGLYEYTGHVWTDYSGKPEQPATTTVFYEPMTEPKSWHLGQPIIFTCTQAYDKATAHKDKVLCGGPSTTHSWVAPGLWAGMDFPIKYLPQWRMLTRGFTQFVTSYQTSDPTAPPPYTPTAR